MTNPFVGELDHYDCMQGMTSARSSHFLFSYLKEHTPLVQDLLLFCQGEVPVEPCLLNKSATLIRGCNVSFGLFTFVLFVDQLLPVGGLIRSIPSSPLVPLFFGGAERSSPTLNCLGLAFVRLWFVVDLAKAQAGRDWEGQGASPQEQAKCQATKCKQKKVLYI